MIWHPRVFSPCRRIWEFEYSMRYFFVSCIRTVSGAVVPGLRPDVLFWVQLWRIRSQEHEMKPAVVFSIVLT